jgi:hypothetical protein
VNTPNSGSRVLDNRKTFGGIFAGCWLMVIVSGLPDHFRGREFTNPTEANSVCLRHQIKGNVQSRWHNGMSVSLPTAYTPILYHNCDYQSTTQPVKHYC